jgi:hypothetical protein
MFNNDSNNIDLKTKESQCHLKSVCLWDSNDFLKLLKFQKNNEKFYSTLLFNIYLSKENYYHLLTNYNFELEKNIYKISSIYSSCDIFNLLINKLLKQMNYSKKKENDQIFLKYTYLFNPNNIAKRAAANLIVKKYIENEDYEYILNFLKKENIDMEIIMNILLIEDNKVENFQLFILQKCLSEEWNKDEIKFFRTILSLSPWLIGELSKKYEIFFTFIFSNLLKELFLIFIKLTTNKEDRLKSIELKPIYDTNIFFENIDKKSKIKLEQIICLIKILRKIKKYQSLIDFHLEDFINTLYQYENTQSSSKNNNNSTTIITNASERSNNKIIEDDGFDFINEDLSNGQGKRGRYNLRRLKNKKNYSLLIPFLENEKNSDSMEDNIDEESLQDNITNVDSKMEEEEVEKEDNPNPESKHIDINNDPENKNLDNTSTKDKSEKDHNKKFVKLRKKK